MQPLLQPSTPNWLRLPILLIISLTLSSNDYHQAQDPFFTATLKVLNKPDHDVLQCKGFLFQDEIAVQREGRLLIEKKKVYQFAFDFSFQYMGLDGKIKTITPANYSDDDFKITIHSEPTVLEIYPKNRRVTSNGYEFNGMLRKDNFSQRPFEILVKKDGKEYVKAIFGHRSDRSDPAAPYRFAAPFIFEGGKY